MILSLSYDIIKNNDTIKNSSFNLEIRKIFYDVVFLLFNPQRNAQRYNLLVYSIQYHNIASWID